jgi:NAD(P)-dependent dehydrogenase (short-subunit alcohol dehydrogenase family)
MRILLTVSNSGFGELASLTLARTGHHVIVTMRSLDRSADPRGTAAAEGLEIEVRQLDTNVFGPLRMIRAVMNTWRERGYGVVVNMSGVVGGATSPFGGAYAALRHALEAVSEALCWEASPAGIRVDVIEPGRFPTTDFLSNIVRPDGWEGSAFEAKALSLRAALTALDAGEPSDPQTVADAIAFAATDPEAPFRTVVGADANLILGAKSSTSFEDFERAMRSTINCYE